MKKLTLILIITSSFIFFSTKTKAQNELGQTKKYVIDSNDECYIEVNDDRLMILDCSGLTQFYFFDEYGLCNIIGVSYPKSLRRELRQMLIEEDYDVIVDNIKQPILLSLTSGNFNNSSPAIIYTNYETTVTVLEYDLVGESSSDYFGIYFEKYDPVKHTID